MTEQEAHLDLQTWMIISTNVLSRVAGVLEKRDDELHYWDLVVKYR